MINEEKNQKRAMKTMTDKEKADMSPQTNLCQIVLYESLQQIEYRNKVTKWDSWIRRDCVLHLVLFVFSVDNL